MKNKTDYTIKRLINTKVLAHIAPQDIQDQVQIIQDDMIEKPPKTVTNEGKDLLV